MTPKTLYVLSLSDYVTNFEKLVEPYAGFLNKTMAGFVPKPT